MASVVLRTLRIFLSVLVCALVFTGTGTLFVWYLEPIYYGGDRLQGLSILGFFGWAAIFHVPGFMAVFSVPLVLALYLLEKYDFRYWWMYVLIWCGVAMMAAIGTHSLRPPELASFLLAGVLSGILCWLLDVKLGPALAAIRDRAFPGRSRRASS